MDSTYKDISFKLQNGKLWRYITWKLGQNFKFAAILDLPSFLISPKPNKTTKIEPIVIKMNVNI